MKTRLPRQELQEALAAASSLASSRTTRPILSCVKLRADGDQLELCVTDGEAALRLVVPSLTTSEPGEAVVAADRLFAIVRELGDVELALEADERYCVIRGAGSEFKVFVMNPADFPPVAQFEDAPDLVVDGRQLRKLIGLTLYAAARETSRYAINGVLWQKQGKKLYVVATDGRRLARAGGVLQKSTGGDFEVILPAKAMNVFERVFVPPKDGDDWRIEVRVLPNQVLLRAGDRMLATVLVEGRFPDYEKVVPRDQTKRAKLNRNEFHAAIRRAALLTTEESRAVRLVFEPERLLITSQSPEQGEARVEMPIEFQGEPLEIGFNPNFVADALRAMTQEEVFVELEVPHQPGVLSGEDKADFLYVVMPVSLAG